ncbi:PEP-CTERM sorting domain-containing protein [Thermodesulfobacteriota bacterium]
MKSSSKSFFKFSFLVIISLCCILSIAVNASAAPITLQADSYVKSTARNYWWGHNAVDTATPLPIPGGEVSTAALSNPQAGWVNNVTTTYSSTVFSGYDPTVFTVTADPQDLDSDGFVQSELYLHLLTDYQFDYDISGFYNTWGDIGGVSENTYFDVSLKDTTSGDYLFINDINETGQPDNLTVASGSPLGSLTGTIAAGEYEFYVRMMVHTSSNDGWSPGDRDGNGSVTLELSNPVPEPTTMLLLGAGLIGLAGFRRRFRKR